MAISGAISGGIAGGFARITTQEYGWIGLVGLFLAVVMIVTLVMWLFLKPQPINVAEQVEASDRSPLL